MADYHFPLRFLLPSLKNWNGRLAMLGFVIGLGTDCCTGQGILPPKSAWVRIRHEWWITAQGHRQR